MALRNKSVFWYGVEVTANKRSIDFRTASGGTIYQATLSLGFYTLTGFIAEILKQLTAANPTTTFTVSINRAAGTSPNLASANRIYIGSNTGFLSLLFLTGPRTDSNAASLMGFNVVDYTGSSSYTGVASAGTPLIPDEVGFSYLSPDFMHNAFGALNVSARGDKEAIVWSIQKFMQVEFKYEPETKVVSQWVPFLDWAIQQRPFEFFPDITSGLTFYELTLESTTGDGKGLGYSMREMLSDGLPFLYQTGIMKFRKKAGS